MQITTQSEIANICMRDFFYKKREIARVYFLNIKNIVLQVLDISIGGLNSVNISIKEIIAKAVEFRAAKIILVHNHPSGISEPSKDDIKFTDQLYNAAQILDIDLIDHIIVAKREYTSVYTYMQEKLKKLKNRNKKD